MSACTAPVIAAVFAVITRAGGITPGDGAGRATGCTGCVGLTSTSTFAAAGGGSVVPGTGGDGETALLPGGVGFAGTVGLTTSLGGVVVPFVFASPFADGGTTSTVVL